MTRQRRQVPNQSPPRIVLTSIRIALTIVLISHPTKTQTQTDDCKRLAIQQDSCPFTLDGECDAGTLRCSSTSDCVDCRDPCSAYYLTSCLECTSLPGCSWCATEGACLTTEYIGWIRQDFPQKLSCHDEATEIASDPAACAKLQESYVFPDVPFYGTNKWVFDLIHVEPVWRHGISKCPCWFMIQRGASSMEKMSFVVSILKHAILRSHSRKRSQPAH